MLNIVALQGRLAADPEQRTTQNGTTVTNFTLAVDRFSKDGNRQTDWIDCVAWRNTAEFISKYFSKGKMIALDGTLQTRSYEKDGVKRKAVEVVVNNANFCESKGDSKASYKDGSQGKPTPTPSQEEMEEILGADDLPF